MHSPEISCFSCLLKLGYLPAFLLVCAVHTHFNLAPMLYAPVQVLPVRTMEDELVKAHVGSK